MQWDALWYTTIGRFGYALSPHNQYLYLRHGNIVPFADPLRATAFFPGLPILIHLIGPIAALIVGNLVFIASIFLMYRLARDIHPSLAPIAAFFYAVNPASLYESALYPEVYLVCLTMFVVFAIGRQTRRFDLLACVAALVLGTFQETACAIAILGLHYLRQRRYPTFMLFVLAALGGWIADTAYLWIRYGQPAAPFIAQSQWGRTWRFPGTALIVQVARGEYLDAFYTLLFVALVALSVYFALRCQRQPRSLSPSARLHLASPEVSLWMLVLTLTDLCTYIMAPEPLMSVVRFLSVLWPVYALPWTLLFASKQRAHYRDVITHSLVALSAAAALWGSVLFTHGYFFQ